jgi:AbrB family looped-hinge helix DNA binding protein
MGRLTDTKVSEKYLTTIPKPVRNFLDLAEGDTVEWHVVDGEIILKVADEDA